MFSEGKSTSFPEATGAQVSSISPVFWGLEALEVRRLTVAKGIESIALYNCRASNEKTIMLIVCANVSLIIQKHWLCAVSSY